VSAPVSTSRPALRALLLVALLGFLVGTLFVGVTRSRAAHDYPDIRGSWTGYACIGVSLAECKQGGEYAQNFTITDENFNTGGVTIEGNGEIGQITGDVLTITWPESGGYLSTNTYKISPCGDSMSGTFSDNYGRSGEPIWVEKVTPEDEEQAGSNRAARAGTATPTCKLKVKISGKVIRRVCDKGAHCKRLDVVPVKGQQVELVRKKKTYETQTNGKGEYTFHVKKGRYAVHLLGTTKKVEPDSRSGSASDDVGDLDFTLCKLPETYEGPTPGCDLVQLEGAATDFFNEPVNGPLLTTRTDSAFIEEGHYSIYAEKGRPGVAVHRIEGSDEDGPGDNIAEGFALPAAADGVNQLDIKLVPHLSYLLDQSKRGVLAYEVWNLPTTTSTGEERRYDLEVFGGNSTSPDALVCSLEGDDLFGWPAQTLANLVGLGPGQLTVAEERGRAVAHSVPGYDGHAPQYCEATYASRLRDVDHDIVIHKLVGDTTGVFKPKISRQR
jgi:hypothetical protein